MNGRPQLSWKRVCVAMTTDLNQILTCQSTPTRPSTAPSSPHHSSWIQIPSVLARTAWGRVIAGQRRASCRLCRHRQSPPPHTKVSSHPTRSPTGMAACLMTACSTPASPQPLPMSAWPTVVYPPWGSTHPTCPPKCATTVNLKSRGIRSPPPIAQWCHPGEWEDNPLTWGTGTHPQCATITCRRPSWPPFRNERRWRSGRSDRYCAGLPRLISMPRTLACLTGAMAYPPVLPTQMGLVDLALEVQHPQPVGAPGTTWWGWGWWATDSEPQFYAMLAPHWAVPLGLHPPPCIQITVAPTAVTVGRLPLRAPFAPQSASHTHLLCPDPLLTPTRNLISVPMRGQTGMNPNIAALGLHASKWANGNCSAPNGYTAIMGTALLVLTSSINNDG